MEPPRTITTRALRAADRPAWERMWQDYLAFYETTLPPEVYDTAFTRLLSGGAHEFHGLIAEADGRPAGLAHYLFHRHGWKIGPVCYLQDLWAEPEARGRGVGRALIEAVYAAADGAGAEDVYWNTQSFNATARRLYDRIGRLTPFVKYVRT